MHDTQETLFTWNKVKYLILTSLEATSSLSKPAAFVTQSIEQAVHDLLSKGKRTQVKIQLQAYLPFCKRHASSSDLEMTTTFTVAWTYQLMHDTLTVLRSFLKINYSMLWDH